MTVERDSSLEDKDVDATVKMPRPGAPPSSQQIPAETDDPEFDPESTLVREDWESTVIRRVAPHVVAVQSQVAEDSAGERRFGWESEGLRRLAHEVSKSGN